MGTSVMCCLALLTLIVAVNARYSAVLPDNSNDQETPLADPATCRGCGSEIATGANAGATAVHQVVRPTTRPRLQKRDGRPLRHSLDGRSQRPSAEPAVPANPTEDGDATARHHVSLQERTNVMLKLMDVLRRMTEEIELETTAVPPSAAAPSSEPRGVPFSVFNSSITTSTSPPSPADRNRVTEELATEESEREKQRVELRIKAAKARMEKAREDPSLMGEYLCKASFNGDKDHVRHLLDNGTDVNYTNTYGYTPLILAFHSVPLTTVILPSNHGDSCNSDVAELLLERGADVNGVGVDGISALHAAAFFDTSGFCAALLLRRGADVDARDKDGVTPLHIAADRDAVLVARALLAAGARKNLSGWSGDWKGITPFVIAKSDHVRDLLRP
ncbi:hypothetical protein R5R35_002585 [Gryllus longicercus]|uniref:Accessory gland protein n=1 Tax=Gryllus longicercus TaxID=2509291 RepID=A0AAN9Z9A1_9ORTH